MGRPSLGSVFVAQLGARRHYAVPIAFHQAGRLGKLCTDFYLGSTGAYRALSLLKRAATPQAFARMVDRHTTELPAEYVRSFPVFGLRYRLKVRNAGTEHDRVKAWIWGGRKFSQLAARNLNGKCGTVYGFSSAAKELFERARELGLRTILDHATAPGLFERALVQEEKERFPDWVSQDEDANAFDEYDKRQRDELDLADVVLCGSTFIKNAIVEAGARPNQVQVVPLGVGDQFFKLQRTPRPSNGPLRVLFLGDDALRKGAAYLAQAMSLLDPKLAQARLVGDLRLNNKAYAALSKSTTVMARIPRSELASCLIWADVLVLPSVSDTFGLVVLEAMASGLPVIATTHSCGPDVVRDGVDGFVVPPRDPVSIAACLENLAENRDRLGWMSSQARIRAKDFTLANYSARLVGATLQ